MDVKTKTIGIIFDIDKNWFGGINYLTNIINSFNFLDENRKPLVIIFSTVKIEELQNLIIYPKIKWVYQSFKSVYGKFLLSFLFRKNFFFHNKMKECDIVFPFNNLPVRNVYKTKIISWIPDFQHKVFKKNFTISNRILREFKFRLIMKNTDMIILSSFNSEKDFKKYYKFYNTNIKILPFTSVIYQDFYNATILNKLGISKNKYFVISNQFHKHKNFEIVIKAFNVILKKNNDFKLVITGAPSNNKYFFEICELVRNLYYSSSIIFTGFLDRKEVLSLLYYSQALIQPSKFEGWNTAIEDCKSMGVSVIASSISVHLEQLGKNGNYFDPFDQNSLENVLINFQNLRSTEKVESNYRNKKFAELILNSFES